jgi:hypothetical protein
MVWRYTGGYLNRSNGRRAAATLAAKLKKRRACTPGKLLIGLGSYWHKRSLPKRPGLQPYRKCRPVPADG